MDNPLTHKAISVHIRSVHLNGSMILLSRLSPREKTYVDPPHKGVTGLTLFPSLPYHPRHAPNPNHSRDQHHGRRLGGLP
jgi:hypothetical protein